MRQGTIQRSAITTLHLQLLGVCVLLLGSAVLLQARLFSSVTTVNKETPFTGRFQAAVAQCSESKALLVTGGSIPAGPFLLNDAWLSMDNGRSWTLQNDSAGWQARGAPSLLCAEKFGIREWLLAGGVGFNGAEFSDLWSSTDDGVSWTLVTDSAAWGPIVAGGFVYSPAADVFLLFGGQNDLGQVVNFVFQSKDGIQWTQLADAPWSARSGQAVTLGIGRIWMAGGALEDYTGLNDVWWTVTGESWTQVSGTAPWSGRLNSGLVFAAGHLYVLGGEIGSPSFASVNDVYSLDVAHNQWTQVYTTTNSPLPASYYFAFVSSHGPTAVTVFDDGDGVDLSNSVYIATVAGTTPTGYVNITFADSNELTAICSDGKWNVYGATLSVSLSVGLYGRKAYASGPLTALLTDDDGQVITLSAAIYLNDEAVAFSANNVFNVANSAVSGNVWSFQLEQWQANIGGSFTFQNAHSCHWYSSPPRVTLAFSAADQVIVGTGSGNIPAVIARPTLFNHLKPVNVHHFSAAAIL